MVRFADRERHQVFLEPEGLDDDTVYPNGISTSLPEDVQAAMIASMPGLQQARIVRPGYAIEYDHVDPRALTPALEVRSVPRLFLAGQINGTTGYEEAAAQGLMAGLNAAARASGGQPDRVLTRGGGLCRRAGGRPGAAGRLRALPDADGARRTPAGAAGRQCRAAPDRDGHRLGLRRARARRAASGLRRSGGGCPGAGTGGRCHALPRWPPAASR